MDEAGARCPVCRCEGGRELGVKNSHWVSRCDACGHLFGTPLPEAKCLAEDYSVYAYDKHDLQHVPAFIFARLDEVVSSFRPYRRTGRLLEVGFGAGAMLKAAQDRGWEVHGIEVSGLAVKQALRNGFAGAAEGDFLTAPYEPGSFDVVVGIELLEHVPDPLAFIQQAFRLLAPGGLFYITTPNGAGLSGRILGLEWHEVAPPEHLHLFSTRSLKLALNAGGFRKVAMACEGVNPYEIAGHFRQALRLPRHADEVSGGGSGPGSSAAGLNEKLTSSRLGSAFKSSANWALRQAGWGDTIKARAVK